MRDIERYVNRNTPDAFPALRKYFKGYIYSLLNSGEVEGRLEFLRGLTDAGVPGEGGSHAGSLFLHGELHPLAESFSDYKYQVAFAYSRLFKDLSLYRIAGGLFFSAFSVVQDYIVGSGTLLSTDIVVGQASGKSVYGSTDTGYYTDEAVEGVLIIRYFLEFPMDSRLGDAESDSFEESIRGVCGLLQLVAPARLAVLFHVDFYFYIGKVLDPSGSVVVESSPFNDQGQMEMIAGYINSGTFADIYGSSGVLVDGDLISAGVEDRGSVKLVTVRSSEKLSLVEVRSGVPGLDDIVCRLNYDSVHFPLLMDGVFGVKLYIDFSEG
jgi:hypothetical protein